MELTRKIKEARTQLKLTQAELAVRANVSLATLQNIEAGRANPEIATLERICEPLGLEINLKKKEIDWATWISIGVPLLSNETIRLVRPDRSILINSLYRLPEVILATPPGSREQIALISFLCALRDHYPKVYSQLKPGIRKQHEPYIQKFASPKLRRLALAKLQEYL